MTDLPASQNGIRAIAFDCYGTLIDFTDARFKETYHEICVRQSLPIEGVALYEKWMEIWRRLANEGRARENPRDWPHKDNPRPLTGDGPTFRPYREEWPEHFQTCFQELGVGGDPLSAYDHVRVRLAEAVAFEETASVLAALAERYRLGILSNADDDFLFPCLEKNGLDFDLIVTSERVGFYKPHEAIFRSFAEEVGAGADQVLYVGDSPFADVLGAKNASMRVAWVNRHGARLGEGMPSPDHEIASLEELLNLLL
jgi:2-haloalkanoic acid dehalogenase type II